MRMASSQRYTNDVLTACAQQSKVLDQLGMRPRFTSFVAESTEQPIKDDIAKVLGQAGYEVPSVLKAKPIWW